MSASRELQAMIQYLEDSGVPHRITSTIRSRLPSYHAREGTDGTGLALDVAGPTPYWKDPKTATRQMRSIFNAIWQVYPQSYEIVWTPTTWNAKRGIKVPTWRSDHRNHVHWAVERGTFVEWSGAQQDAPVRITVGQQFYDDGNGGMMRRIEVDIPRLDDQGNGWVFLEIPLERIVSLVPWGSFPPDDGYWDAPQLAAQRRDDGPDKPKTCVTITEGPPGGHVMFWAWVAE